MQPTDDQRLRSYIEDLHRAADALEAKQNRMTARQRIKSVNDWIKAHKVRGLTIAGGIGALIAMTIDLVQHGFDCNCWMLGLIGIPMIVIPSVWGSWRTIWNRFIKGTALVLVAAFLLPTLPASAQEAPPPPGCPNRPQGGLGGAAAAAAAALVVGAVFHYYVIPFCRRHFGPQPPPPPPPPQGTNAPPANDGASYRKGCPHGTCARLADDVEQFHGTYVALSVLGGRITGTRVFQESELIDLSDFITLLNDGWNLDTSEMQTLEFRSTTPDISIDDDVWVFRNGHTQFILEKSTDLETWEPVVSWRAPDDMRGVLNVSEEEGVGFYRITQ